MRQIFTTNEDMGLLVIRVVIGLVIAAHGAQKLFGWFGGYGFAGTMGYLTGTVGLPYAVGILVIVAEFFGGIALVFGVAVRPAALGIIAIMIGAVVTGHLANGFFMNWGGTQKGEGYEYHLVVTAACLALVIGGAGRWSLDSFVAHTLP